MVLALRTFKLWRRAMGEMINGEWRSGWYTPDEKGHFRRPQTVFRDWLSTDGSTRFQAEPGRYHLYASYACPWASRALILRKLKKLEAAIPVSIVDPRMGDEGWTFGDFPGSTKDAANGAQRLQDVYRLARSDYTGRVTVPVLWDTKHKTIVNNESRDVMRMLDHACNAFADGSVDLCPEALRQEVDARLDEMYEPINNGVYRAGFAGTQEAYAQACREVFAALERYDALLATRRYLCGDVLTEADIALYTTLVRFDVVYYSHFKLNLARIEDYEHLSGYLRDIYQTPGFTETTHLE
jgi:glutathionyl-hydroquinone reductase